MIVKCHPTQPDKTDCPNLPYCLARLSDPTITGCGMPLWEAGIIRREEIVVEHTVRGGADNWTTTNEMSGWIKEEK